MSFTTTISIGSVRKNSRNREKILCKKITAKVSHADKVWDISAQTDEFLSARKVEISGRLKPMIKWAGGKSQILNKIRRHYPQGLGKSIQKYAEPFVGGAAVLWDILSTYKLDEVFISDTNAELINLYKILRDNVENLIYILQKYQKEFIPLDEASRKKYYFCKRERFNELKKSADLGLEIAGIFMFLNKTCFNGLYRVNSKGDFNVPIGSYKEPLICDKDNLIRLSQALTNVQIVHGDYHMVENFADEHTFVYFDPPYRPLSTTAKFTSYTEKCFDDNAQQDLAQFIISLAKKGSCVLASNSDPHNTNASDDFFDNLYAPLNIERITATRMINCKSDGRGKLHELLIYNQ